MLGLSLGLRFCSPRPCSWSCHTSLGFGLDLAVSGLSLISCGLVNNPDMSKIRCIKQEVFTVRQLNSVIQILLTLILVAMVMEIW